MTDALARVAISLFFLPAFFFVGTVVWYNTINYMNIRNIQKKYEAQGGRWDYWSNPQRRIMCLINPQQILLEEPGVAVDEKERWLVHRRLMGKYIIRAVLLALASILLGVGLLLTVGMLGHR